MESMDNVRERFAALEQRTEHLKHQVQALGAQGHTLLSMAFATLVLIGTLLSTLAFAQAPSYTFQNLQVPFPNAQNGTFAQGINDYSVVVGSYVELGGTQHGFIEAQGKYITFDVPNASNTSLVGINNQGEIVGTYTKGTKVYGFLYKHGRFTILPIPPD